MLKSLACDCYSLGVPEILALQLGLNSSGEEKNFFAISILDDKISSSFFVMFCTIFFRIFLKPVLFPPFI